MQSSPMMSRSLLLSHKKMYRMALKLLFPLSEKHTYKIIAEEAKQLVNAKYCSIFLYQDREIKRVYTTFPKLHKVIPMKDGATWRVYKEKKSILRKKEAIIRSHPEMNSLGINTGSDISVPLMYNKKVIGVLSAFSYEHKSFTLKQVEELEIFSPLATLAIINMELRQKQQKALEFRDLFISLASHELKTPLTVISIYSELLASNKIVHSGKEEEIKAKLDEEVKKIKKLTNELLEIDQIKQGKLIFTMKVCNVADVVERTVKNFQTSHPDNRIELIKELTDGQAVINGDCDKLSQAVLNLLVNAVKFSSPQQKIIVRISRKRKHICIEVTDFGEGIPSQDLPGIFQQFYRGKNSTKDGMGLGLYLVKTIVDKHNGKITVDSQLNHGTTFCIQLPQYER